MLDVFILLLKFFVNELFERFMYTIIIFGFIFWLISKEFIVVFNVYIEIFWFF